MNEGKEGRREGGGGGEVEREIKLTALNTAGVAFGLFAALRAPALEAPAANSDVVTGTRIDAGSFSCNEGGKRCSQYTQPFEITAQHRARRVE